MKEMRAEFDKKIEEMQNKLDKSMKRGKETVNDVKERINTGHDMIMDVLESGEDTVREHPIIAVGGAFVVGLLIGVLFSRKSSH